MFTRLKFVNERMASIAILAFIVVALLLKLINVFNAPAHWDTGLYLNIAVGYFERGILTPLMWRYNPEWNIVTGSGSGYGIFLLIGWVKLFGISVLSGHLLMYVVGIINLPIIYLLGKRFYNSHEAGLWAVSFFALSGTYAQDFYARMDAANILVCSLILLLHLEAVRRNKWWLHAAVGVALVAALEFHILAAVYTGGIGLYYAVQYLTQVIKERRVIWYAPAIPFGIGLGVAVIIYYLHHIAPNPAIYFMIPRSCGICTPFTVFKEIERWYRWVSLQPVFTLFMVSLAIFTAIRRHSSTDRHYLLLLGGAYIAFLILNPPAGEVYTGHLLPLFALGVGGLFALGPVRNRSQLTVLRIAGLLVSVTAVIVLIMNTYFTYARTYISPILLYYSQAASEPEYHALIDYIRANISTDTVIVGHETHYLDLVDYHKFMSFHGLEGLGVEQRQETYFDLWKREKPQVFIGDARNDPDMQRYTTWRGDFIEVLPKLWVEQSLLTHSTSMVQR